MNLDWEKRSFYLPIVSVSACAFGYFSLVSPVVSAMVSGAHIHLILVGPLLAFALAILLFGQRLRSIGQKSSLWVIMVGSVPLSIPISLVILKLLQGQIDESLTGEMPTHMARILEDLPTYASGRFGIWISVAASLPFFFYGLYISWCFHRASSGSLGRVYGLELVGTIIGYFFGLNAIEFIGVGWSAAVLMIVAILPLIFIHREGSYAVLLLILIFAWVLGGFSSWILPQRNLHLILRDFKKEGQPRVIDTAWTSYAKVQLIENTVGDRSYYIVALGDGTGQAAVPTPGVQYAHFPALIAAALEPRSMTILFAGAGSDLVYLKSLMPPGIVVTAVEMNPKVLEFGIKTPKSLVSNLYREGSVHVINQEARRFIETNQGKSDLLMFSWSGATVAHYSGAVLHTTQYSFTTEALASAMTNLKPDGVLVLFGASKANLLLSAKSLEGSLPRLGAQSYLLLGRRKHPDSWLSGWEDNVLLIKNGSFSEQQVFDLNDKLSAFGMQVIVSANILGDRKFAPIQEAMLAINYQLAVEAMNFNEFNSRAYFQAHFDDRPFVYSIMPPIEPFGWSFWGQVMSDLKSLKVSDEIAVMILLLVLGLVIAIVMAAMLNPKIRAARSMVGLVVMGLTGFFSTGLGLLTIYKAVLYLGNPNWAIMMPQSILLASSTVGAAYGGISTWWRRRLTWVRWIPIAVLCLTIVIFFHSSHKVFFNTTIFLMAVGVLGLSAILSSFFYKEALIQLGIADGLMPRVPLLINSLSAVIGALWFPFVVEHKGVAFASIQLAIILPLIFFFGTIQKKMASV